MRPLEGVMWRQSEFDENKAIEAYVRRCGEKPNTVYHNTEVKCKMLRWVYDEGYKGDYYLIGKE